MSKLNSDAALLALMPNNVWWQQADEGLTRFVIVSLIEALDVGRFGSRSHEDALYLVKAVALGTANATNVYNAAARIDTLLDHQPLTATGYGHMAMFREERIGPFLEVDDVDPKIRWYHMGGQYRVIQST